MKIAAITDLFQRIYEAAGSFVDSFAQVEIIPLLLGMVIFVLYLSMRALALYNTLGAAYPDERIPYRNIWGAYIAAYGFNNIVPARGGDIIKFFLVKVSVPQSTYPAIGAAFVVESIFDLTIAIPVLTFAFSRRSVPKHAAAAEAGDA